MDFMCIPDLTSELRPYREMLQLSLDSKFDLRIDVIVNGNDIFWVVLIDAHALELERLQQGLTC
jgi:hypothetical protein